MTPEQALEILISATSIARLTEADRNLCKQAYATISAELAPPPDAPAKRPQEKPAKRAKKQAAKKIRKNPRVAKKSRGK